MTIKKGIYSWDPASERVSELSEVYNGIVGKFYTEEINKLKWQLVYIAEKTYTFIPSEVLELICDVILFHRQVDFNGLLPIPHSVQDPNAAPKVFIRDTKGLDYYLCRLSRTSPKYSVHYQYVFLSNEYEKLREKLEEKLKAEPQKKSYRTKFYLGAEESSFFAVAKSNLHEILSEKNSVGKKLSR